MAKVSAFFGLHGIQITDLSTKITDLGMLTNKGMNNVVILNR
jgi:hypothetical protein